MYTILENARIVLSLLKKHNIKHIVVSPGGSNIPIVQGCQNDPFFTCYSVVDERSAMYFAIGLYLKLGVPVATSCTSAQATRNYLPGLTEAFYKRVPILAITMSKHPRFLGQDYMQCPIQTSLPVDAVKKSYSLPYISSKLDRDLCIRTTNEAILELTHNGMGPVQLNIEELDSETWQFDKKIELPDVRSIFRYTHRDGFTYNLTGKKVLLVIGEHIEFKNDEVEALDSFCRKYNVFVYSDHISNYHGEYARNACVVATNLSQKLFDKEFAPDILMTIGGLTGDYGIFNVLINSQVPFEHWRIDVDGNVVDTYGKLAKVFQMSLPEFVHQFDNVLTSEDHTYFKLWESRLKEINYDLDIPFSNMYAAQQLHERIPSNSFLNFAILNSLRCWNVFQIDSTIKCFSNVAAFGIDGCLSVMLGQSVLTDQLTFHVTGDLAFFYDMNALGIRHIGNNVRILIVNNNGGAEFKLGNLESKTEVSPYISAAGHFKNAKGWAETNGFKYMSAVNKEEFAKLIDTFVTKSDMPIIIEIFTTPEDERTANYRMSSRNWKGLPNENILNSIKANVKESIGQDGVNTLKQILNM